MKEAVTAGSWCSVLEEQCNDVGSEGELNKKERKKDFISV